MRREKDGGRWSQPATREAGERAGATVPPVDDHGLARRPRAHRGISPWHIETMSGTNAR
ncbi:MAG: hypothetical protein LAP21_22025 [Acidobacteriia bacterium]|nr:hypothetical protein [Terriglobia bacterium]